MTTETLGDMTAADRKAKRFIWWLIGLAIIGFVATGPAPDPVVDLPTIPLAYEHALAVIKPCDGAPDVVRCMNQLIDADIRNACATATDNAACLAAQPYEWNGLRYTVKSPW